MADDSVFAGPAQPIGSSDASPFAGPPVSIKSALSSELVEDQRRWGPSSYEKDILRGVAESATGIGELIPYLHEPAAKASAYLHGQVRHPTAEFIGEAIPYLYGGEFGAGRLGSLIPRGTGFLTDLVSGMGRGALQWAVPGALMGAATPTGEESYPKSLEEKGLYGVSGGLLGGVIGGGAGAIPSLARGASEVVSRVTGKGVAKEVEAARSAIEGKIGAAMGSEVQRQADILKRAGEIKVDLTKVNEGLGRLVDTQKKLAATEAARVNPQAVAQTQNQVAVDIGVRLRDAEQAARKAGMPFDVARAFAVLRESAVTDVESAAEQFSRDIATRPGIDAKTFGERIRSVSKAIYDKYDKIRSDQSGYSEVLQRHGNDSIVKTADISKYIDDELAKTANPSKHDILSWVKSQLGAKTEKEAVEPTWEIVLSRGDQKGTVISRHKTREAAIAAADKGGGGANWAIRETSPESELIISLPKADSLRKTLDTAIRQRRMRIGEKGDADVAEARWALGRINTMLRSAMPEDFRQALERYRQLSRPLDFVERKGLLADALKREPISGEPTKLSADLVGAVLRKTRGGAQLFGRLVQEDSALKEDARLYFQHDLFGEEGFGKPITPQKFSDFLRRNKDALQQTDLWSDFADLHRAQKQAQELVDTAKIESERGAGLEQELKETSKVLGLSEKRVQTYRDLLSEFSPSSTPKNKVFLAGKAREIVSHLHDDGYIDQSGYGDALEDIARIEDEIADMRTMQTRLRRVIETIGYLALGYEGFRGLWAIIGPR
jgi:hypothetical protein